MFEFLNDSPFVTYSSVETPRKITKYSLPLGDVDLFNGLYVGDNGKIQVDTIEESQKDEPKIIVNNTEEVPILTQIDDYSNNKNITINKSKESENLSKVIDEVSNEKGYEELKDSNIKKLIMLQAQRESSFNPSATSKSSTASGYFQFIDGTRKRYSKMSKNEFLNNPKEQVRAAYKYLKDIHNSQSAKLLKQKGYNDSLITALGWWYPKSMDMVLEGKKNFSLGGYSIQKAFKDYG